MAQNELPEASGDPLGTPWAPGGCQDAIKIDPGALLEASGGEKKFTGSGRGGPRKVLGPFFIVLRPPRRDFGLLFASPGGSREVLFGAFSKKRENPGFLNTFRVETMVL